MVAQRLPWLVFTLPAGVITDRVDRRKAMVAMDLCRFALTLVVAFAVLGKQGTLPDPDDLGSVTGTQTGLYLIVLLATLLLGMAEVLRDNSAQTIMPAIVDTSQLEKANGRMWSIESDRQHVHRPAARIAAAARSRSRCRSSSTPASFFVAAALVFLIPGSFRADGHGRRERKPWRTELAEGFRWLWGHSLLRPMAIILGVMNGAIDDHDLDVRAVRPGGARRRTAAVHRDRLRRRDRCGRRRCGGRPGRRAVWARHLPVAHARSGRP